MEMHPIDREELRRAIALVATREIGPWPEELLTMADVERIFPGSRTRQHTSDAGPAAVQGIRSLRDTLAAVLLDPHAPDAAARLDGLVAEYAITPRVPALGEPVTYRSARTGLVGHVAGRVIGASIAAYSTGEVRYLHECGADGCITPFLDTSPRHNRAYCSDRCSTKMRVRRHRQA